MAKETVYMTKHTLSSLFDGSFKLLKPTWKHSLIPSLIFYLPISVVTGFFLSEYFRSISAISSMASESTTDPWGFLRRLGGLFAVMPLYAIVSVACGALLSGNNARIAYKAIASEPISWRAVLSETLKRHFGRIVLFELLSGALIFAVILVYTAIVVGLVVLFVVLKFTPMAIVLGVLAYIGLFLVVYVAMAICQLGLPAIVNEDLGASAALKACFRLIRGNLVRMSFNAAIFAIAVSLLLSVVTMPVQIVGMLPMFASLISQTMNGSLDSSNTEALMLQMGQGMGIGMAFITEVVGALSIMIMPLFQTLCYIDLKVRHEELPDAAAFTKLDA